MNVFQNFAVESKSPFDVDKLADRFRHRNTGWSIPEAFLGILYFAASADGNFDAKEVETIKSVVTRSRAMTALSPQDLAKADASVNERMKSRPNALQEACETLSPDMCLPVFAHCVDIILSDGQLLKPEADFLQALAKMLDIDPDNARRVMEVLLLKAQY
ncbi:MAG: TerB family tellurite resistance protein [Alphaproteobacteria bacterium]|nr:TerB family tellurite resistance protein [Alphaproteobacteria bacterium]